MKKTRGEITRRIKENFLSSFFIYSFKTNANAKLTGSKNKEKSVLEVKVVLIASTSLEENGKSKKLIKKQTLM